MAGIQGGEQRAGLARIHPTAQGDAGGFWVPIIHPKRSMAYKIRWQYPVASPEGVKPYSVGDPFTNNLGEVFEVVRCQPIDPEKNQGLTHMLVLQAEIPPQASSSQ